MSDRVQPEGAEVIQQLPSFAAFLSFSTPDSTRLLSPIPPVLPPLALPPTPPTFCMHLSPTESSLASTLPITRTGPRESDIDSSLLPVHHGERCTVRARPEIDLYGSRPQPCSIESNFGNSWPAIQHNSGTGLFCSCEHKTFASRTDVYEDNTELRSAFPKAPPAQAPLRSTSPPTFEAGHVQCLRRRASSTNELPTHKADPLGIFLVPEISGTVTQQKMLSPVSVPEPTTRSLFLGTTPARRAQNLTGLCNPGRAKVPLINAMRLK